MLFAMEVEALLCHCGGIVKNNDLNDFLLL